jgi:peroxiredoxin
MEIPEFKAFVEEYPDIPVLGIAVDGNATQLANFSKQYQMNYPILIADQQIKEEYAVDILPMTVVVGPEGEVRDVHSGMMLKQQLEWATH